MSQHLQGLSETIYVPAINIRTATFRHSLSRVQVASINAPGHVCGVAQRVGYTGSQDQDLAIYRLKIKTDNHLATMLPGFFVIKEGVFLDYEQWCQNKDVK